MANPTQFGLPAYSILREWNQGSTEDLRFLMSRLAHTAVMETAPEQHNFIELVYVLHGTPRFHVDGKLYRLSPGKLLIIDSGQTHQMIFSGDSAGYERIVVYFSPTYLRQLSSSIAPSQFEKTVFPGNGAHAWAFSFSPEQRSFIGSLLDMQFQNQALSDEFTPALADDLWRAFFSLLIRASRAPEDTADLPTADALSPLSVNLLQYIEAHYTEEISLDTLAGLFYTSKNSLMSTFRRDIGTGIYNYLLQRRAAEARRMLLQGAAPTDVALRCGFHDYSNFYRAFSAIYGCGPREYVKRESGRA